MSRCNNLAEASESQMWHLRLFKDPKRRSEENGCELREKPYYLFAFLQCQRLPNVGNVIKWLQLRHARAQHHGEQVDEEISMLPDGQVGFITHLLEPGGRWKRECERDKQKVNIFIQFVSWLQHRQEKKRTYKRSSMLGNDTYCLMTSVIVSANDDSKPFHKWLLLINCLVLPSPSKRKLSHVANSVKRPQTCFPDRKDASQLLL